jgi:hypothetical protein
MRPDKIIARLARDGDWRSAWSVSNPTSFRVRAASEGVLD